MYEELSQYLVDHPVVLAAAGVFVIMAVIGAWYVVSHHLHVVLTTLLCAAGFASGILVLYRGYSARMNDLMAVGGFLIIIFPIVYQQAIQVAKIAYGGPSAMSKGHARRAGV